MHSYVAEHKYLFVLQLYAEAAVLYDKAECWDKAAAVYIKNKNWYGIKIVMIIFIVGSIHSA